MGLLLFFVILLSGCSQKQTNQRSNQPEQASKVQQQSPPITDQQNQNNTALKTYQNQKYGFEVSFPPTWKSSKGDFGYNEEVSPDFGYISFQPDGTKYEIIQIGVYTNKQWNKWQHKQDEFILGQNQHYVFTSSSDPDTKLSDENCNGGGQFNKFEQERCKETPQILKSFRIINQ